MKLTSWSAAVKPDRVVLLCALCSTAFASLLLLLTWSLLDPREDRMDRFGAATVGALGQLCIEPLLKQDLLHLGVIGNRLVELDAVAAVATYTVDDQLLTLTGIMEGPQYSESISIDGTVVGHVRIALDPAAFHSGITTPENRSLVTTLTAFIILGSAFGAAALAQLFREWRAGRLVFRAPNLGERMRYLRTQDAPAPETAEPAEAAVEDVPPPTVLHFLLGVNLYNQLSLKGVEREFELSLCAELAEAVALEYQGQVVSLPGLGALVDFDDTDQDDRAFQIVCASFALSRLLRDEAPFGIYRLGLHLVSRVGDEPLPVDHPAVRDVALLSALARDNTLAISQSMVQAIDQPDRMVAKPMANVLLEELSTSGPDCQLVTDLAGPDKAQVLQLVDSLKTQRDSIASESTF